MVVDQGLRFGVGDRWVVGGRYLGVYLSDSLAGVVDRGEGRGEDHSLNSRGAFLDSFEDCGGTNDRYIMSIRRQISKMRNSSSTYTYLGQGAPSSHP